MAESEKTSIAELLIRFDPVVDQESASAIVAKLAEALAQHSPPDVATRVPVARIIRSMPQVVRKAEQAQVEGLRNSLNAAAKEDPRETGEVLLALIRLIERLEPGDLHQRISQYVGSAGVEDIDWFAARAAQEPREDIPINVWLDPFDQRLGNANTAESTDAELSCLVRTCHALGEPDEALQRIIRAFRRQPAPNFGILSEGFGRPLDQNPFDRRRNLSKEGIQEIFDAIAGRLVSEPSITGGDEAASLLVRIVSEWPIPPASVLDPVNKLIEFQDETARRLVAVIAELLARAETARDLDRREIVDQIIRYLDRETPASELQYEQLLNALFALRDVTDRDERIYGVVRSYSRPDELRPSHVPPQFRIPAYRGMARMAYLPSEGGEHELGEILAEAKGAADAAIRHEILAVLLALRRKGVLRRSKRWREVEEYEPYREIEGRRE